MFTNGRSSAISKGTCWNFVDSELEQEEEEEDNESKQNKFDLL